MNKIEAKRLLQKVRDREVSVDDALLSLRREPFENIGIAHVDNHRGLRQGASEIIFGEGKTHEQIEKIAINLHESGEETIIITRLSQDKSDSIEATFKEKSLPYTYFKEAKIGLVGKPKFISSNNYILVTTGGTGDIPVAEEAAVTAELLGNRVVRLYDVGVSGIHRTLSHLDEILNAKVVIAIAGMEGALASVMGGLTDAPVIGVPTSVGYGAAFGGVTALLSMLNSCSAGVSVVNIDNGFGAGFLASRIIKMGE